MNILLYGSVIETLLLFSKHGIVNADPIAPPPMTKIFFILKLIYCNFHQFVSKIHL